MILMGVVVLIVPGGMDLLSSDGWLGLIMMVYGGHADMQTSSMADIHEACEASI